VNRRADLATLLAVPPLPTADYQPGPRALDELLVLRAQGGDAGAFEALLARWDPRLRAYAAAHAARGADPRDAVQETWLAVVRALPRLRDPGAFPGLLFATLRRRCADTIRRAGRGRGRPLGGEAEAPPAESPEMEEFSEAARRLAPATRELLWLRYIAELGVVEIAGVLGVPAGTVKSRLHAARAELKSHLERKTDAIAEQ
jgi:RNA polymerase sigma factor (sigma-70 family)